MRENKLQLSAVKKQFGDNVAKCIDGVSQMAAIGSRINPRISDAVLGQKHHKSIQCVKCWLL